MPEETHPPDSLELAKDAINYTLSRVREDPNIRYHMGAFTEAFERLKVAHSALTGISEKAIEEGVLGHELKRVPAAKVVENIKDVIYQRSDETISADEAISKIRKALGF